MADVLSQSQIDALLNSMQNAESDKKAPEPEKPKQEYRKYDFYSPKKYTKDKLKMLRSIYDNYSRIATSQINGLFRLVSEVEVVGIEEQRYYEFGNALNETDVLTVAEVDLPDNSTNPPVLFHIAPTLMTAMIDRMLGGLGFDRTIDISYTYTDIELALYEKIIKYLVAINTDVWGAHITLKTEFEHIEENPSMFQGISVDETVVIIMLNIMLGDLSGTMNICIPGTLLSNIFDIIDKTKHIAKKGEHTKSNREEIMDSIRESSMDVMAQLGVAKLNLDDVYNLHVGDVIDLNKPQDSLVSLFIEGQPWFNGQLGVHNKNVAVKIEDRIIENIENKEDVAV
ncbi:flagellar motor switch protein FliM [Schaedlerella arabinosiphila]|jgi:flagellar motor switch protein FliM|uniref:Flagellar motor switch protein FliM n=1 Tax=Schaedlerella arabinosiphila TaxID=2044587 RepID=A0A9X5H656_9FIRM|nr:FliM/FliN family flagellar motor switch protein [Schaedlerella arabinosiphila]KAI4441808.1 Flagellar motor switch protein FliM [Schaedlerella arabinosiphila]MCI9631904.1 flagellar motor switch protein FliM [Ruminococcus sp.]NDO68753.1 flagellar motor switch protein FliM [Schaedlerella arabinosiphila]